MFLGFSSSKTFNTIYFLHLLLHAAHYLCMDSFTHWLFTWHSCIHRFHTLYKIHPCHLEQFCSCQCLATLKDLALWMQASPVTLWMLVWKVKATKAPEGFALKSLFSLCSIKNVFHNGGYLCHFCAVFRFRLLVLQIRSRL